ncbi:MAG TPA: hypothetical protein VF642_12235 [Propionibacteriaceae bacterium]|jgi:hypothetical protein
MAINVYGVVGTIDDGHWAQLLQDLGDGGNGMSVAAGLLVSPATGTRLVSVTSGRSVQAGTWATVDASTVSLVANTTSNTRFDVVCLQVNWAAATAAFNATAGDLATKAAAARGAAGSLIAVQGTPGTSPVLPALTQNPGVLWQTPLAMVRVPGGAGQLAASDVTRCRPLPLEKTCSGTSTLVTGENRTIAFPYYLFDSPPRVALTPRTAAGASTNSNLSTGLITKDSFVAELFRSNTAEVTFDWIASGV